MSMPVKLLVIIVIVLIVGFGLVFLDRNKQPSCALVDGDQASYKAFLDAQGNNSLNLRFEVTAIVGEVNGRSTRGIYKCPGTLTEVEGALKEKVTLEDKEYHFIYQRLSDYEYTLTVKVGDESVRVAN